MTTMDSDSESQDSDDGRRFRFEATRKDNVQMDTKMRKLSTLKSQQESCYSNTEHKNKKDKFKHNYNKEEHKHSKELNNDNRDSKYSTKYLKNETKNSRRENNKDYKNLKDISLDTKNIPLSSKHKTKETKKHKSQDRNLNNKSQERCHSKNENDRSQNGKHKNKCHEKYNKHHTCDRNRDKSNQTCKMRFEDSKFREEFEKYNIHKKISVKEDEKKFLSKNIKQDYCNNESLTKREIQKVESQEYNELNLSEFNILSKKGENITHISNVKNKNSLLQLHDKNSKKRYFNNEHNDSSKKDMIEIEAMEKLPKVNARKNDLFYGSSNNNSGTISDISLNPTSPILMESRKNIIDLNNREVICTSLEENNIYITEPTSLHLNNCNSVKVIDINEKITTYGPALPPQLKTDPSNNMESNKDFIGPCLPKNNARNINEKIEKDTVNNISRDNIIQDDVSYLDIFGPALPPHLLKQKYNDDMNTKIIGPILPNTAMLFHNYEINQIESEDEDGIGPLPANHPALENNFVYKQLEQRAQQIKNEQKDEDYGILNQREEWMTELPPSQINNLGLTSRKFRMRAGPDMSDRSCWTDTPAKKTEKRKREEEKLYNDRTLITNLSIENDEIDYQRNRKCEKSLLEIHQDKLRKKKLKEEKKTGQTIRRPFDRDIDLRINRFNQNKKNAIINKAQNLNERFSLGKL
ncbi:putative uncharacterized protein DDB_G0282499 [Apis laboriosa]|uniref:putative uncharacterized protein DDB_G0282499 n=1 Tax=Apis laboriosa TaxID=183418 RepID=UPI001CC71A88|nr:putative uncharacterized protein DDB_G0282499 [Apis laboriosa]